MYKTKIYIYIHDTWYKIIHSTHKVFVPSLWLAYFQEVGLIIFTSACFSAVCLFSGRVNNRKSILTNIINKVSVIEKSAAKEWNTRKYTRSCNKIRVGNWTRVCTRESIVSIAVKRPST